MNRILIFILLISLFSSCEKEDCDSCGLDSNSIDLIVLNEGNFRQGNATVTAYNSGSATAFQNVFFDNNQSRPLGDVAQSLVAIDHRLFIVVNNSNKIEVIDRQTFKTLGQITGLNSPRYILPISATKAYVSDLYSDEIRIINPQTYQITGVISTKGWTEEMVLVNQEAYVAHVDSHQVWVIDVTQDQIIKKIDLGHSPQHIEVDAMQNIWVASSGGFRKSFPELAKINSVTKLAKRMVLQDSSKSIGHLDMNPSRTEIYFHNSDLYKMDIQDSVLPQQPFIQSNSRLFYNFAIHPQNGEIFITDAIDYQQRGVVYQYNSSGVELANFYAGIIPSSLHFLK